jgi:tetratricopeptide (TPR) repeat protein
MNRLEKLRKLAEAMPDDPLAHYGVGLEQISLADWDGAVEAFEAALRADPRYVPAFYHKARAQIAAGRAGAARQTLEAGIRLARELGDAHAEGEMHELLGSVA